MKRVLIGVALATLLVMGGTASADTSATCGAALGVHNAAACTATDKVVMDGVPTLSVAVGIGPVEDIFYGDVQVNLKGDTSLAVMQLTCVHRPTTLLASSCSEVFTEGTFIPGELAVCSGRAAGVGQWSVACSVQSAGG